MSFHNGNIKALENVSGNPNSQPTGSTYSDRNSQSRNTYTGMANDGENTATENQQPAANMNFTGIGCYKISTVQIFYTKESKHVLSLIYQKNVTS